MPKDSINALSKPVPATTALLITPLVGFTTAELAVPLGVETPLPDVNAVLVGVVWPVNWAVVFTNSRGLEEIVALEEEEEDVVVEGKVEIWDTLIVVVPPVPAVVPLVPVIEKGEEY